MRIRILFFALFFIPLFTFKTSFSKEIEIPRIIENMSLEQKIGQLFIWDFNGKVPSKKVENLIKKYGINSFIIFKKNLGTIDQIKSLTSYIKLRSLQHLSVPPLISMDHEGGVVSRLPLAFPIPSPLSLGQTEYIKYTEILSDESAKILQYLGFNMNLAPVLDISDPFLKTFIASRSFGGNLNVVNSLGIEFTTRMIDNGILPTAKHFPGIGSFQDDPHKTKTISNETIEDLKNINLIPFKNYINLSGPKAIMISHHVFQQIDPKPASLSKKIVTDLLINEFKFDGLIITDDLMMEATLATLPITHSVIEAYKAGIDLIMVAWSENNQRKAFNSLLNYFRSNPIEISGLNIRISKILKIKFELQKLKNNNIKFKHDREFIDSDIIAKVSESVLNFNSGNQAKKIIQNKRIQKTFPNHLCLISQNYEFTKNFSDFYNKKFSIYKNLTSLNNFQDINCDFYIFHISSEASLKLIRKAAKVVHDKGESNVVIVNTITPYFGKEFSNSYRILDFFSQHHGTANRISQLIPILYAEMNSSSSN